MSPIQVFTLKWKQSVDILVKSQSRDQGDLRISMYVNASTSQHISDYLLCLPKMTPENQVPSLLKYWDIINTGPGIRGLGTQGLEDCVAL